MCSFRARVHRRGYFPCFLEKEMKVRNRSGVAEDISYDEIKSRIARLCGPDECTSNLDLDQVVIKTIQGIYDGITTSELDDLSARMSASLQSSHYGYDDLAGRIVLSNLRKNAAHVVQQDAFSAKIAFIERTDPGTFDDAFLTFVSRHASTLDAFIDHSRDNSYNYFAARTLERAYLMRVRVSGDSPAAMIIETPQDMWMRVAVALHCPRRRGDKYEDDDEALSTIRRCYDAMSRGLYTHATPTLFNAGTTHQQLSSCYLLGIEDSLGGIYGTLADCAQISKWAGGIGLHVSNVRAKGSTIHSTKGTSDGIVPMLKVFNETARYCNQSGRRKGSIAIYLEPWHADVWEFVELRRNTGAETERTRDLFLALWIPDAFMRAVVSDEPWHLMSPDLCPGLSDVFGEEFDALYARYVAEDRCTRTIRARELWQHVLQCQIETGTPYVLYKDAVNRKCNQRNLGPIRSSNLCAEITEYSDSQLQAVCNLGSIAINRFLRRRDDADDEWEVDHDALHSIAIQLTRSLDRIIDINFYPTPGTRTSNESTRPLGIGIQGLADLLCLLRLDFDSDEARRIDAEIMETIYHGALCATIDLAREHGRTYPAFQGSPFSEGRTQRDMWLETHGAESVHTSGRWDWDALRADMIRHGTRNSLLTALMPTASTSQILGNCECFEPFHSNAFKRTTIAGEFMVVNRHLMRDLMKAGLWTEDLRAALIAADGSVQGLQRVPPDLKRLYRTVWEIPQRGLIDHALARGPFVDQSQSMNLFFATPNFQKLSSALVYGWKYGLKTGMYYLRSLPASEAFKITRSLVPSSSYADDSHKDVAAAAAADAVCPLRPKRENDDHVQCDLCSA